MCFWCCGICHAIYGDVAFVVNVVIVVAFVGDIVATDVECVIAVVAIVGVAVSCFDVGVCVYVAVYIVLYR